MKLGVDIFTLRYEQGWTPFDYLDYGKRIGLDLIHFSELAPFASLDEAHLQQVRDHADKLGMSIEMGMGSICPTSSRFSAADGTAVEQLSRLLTVAHTLGSPAVRCYLGSNADRHTGLARHMAATAETCHAVREQALDLGIKIAIENHAGDMQGRELKQLIEMAGPEFVGACIDTGNPLWVGESPFVTLEHLAPYVVMAHIRDSLVWPHPQGAAVQWVAMGDGNVGIAAWAERFKTQCPHANFTLEIIASSPPAVLNYLEPGFWEIYPETPAAEFARFLTHVQPGAVTQPTVTIPWGTDAPELRAAAARQERLALEKSVRFCRTVLGVGE